MRLCSEFLLVAGCFACLWIAGKLVLPVILRFISHHGLISPNYAGVSIPFGLGLFVWWMNFIMLVMMDVWNEMENRFMQGLEIVPHSEFIRFFTGMSMVFFAGWLDDTLGDRKVKGLKGHWRKWREEKVMTTGWVKAFGTGIASLWIAAQTASPLWTVAVQAPLLLLTTNAFNLLDLRPGRALKAFLASAGCTVCFVPSFRAWTLLLPSLTAAMLLLPGDVKARHMLGDAGANTLGFAAGYGFISFAPLWLQAAAVVLLAGIHRYAERHSITEWIEGNKLFNWLDRIGRA